MAAFTRSDDLQDATFVGVNLRGARFAGGAVICHGANVGSGR